MKKKVKKRGPNVRTAIRKQLLTQEIAKILSTEAHNWFTIIQSRENTVSERLNSMEQSAMPYNAIQEIKGEISKLTYSVQKNTRAIESLLNFFNATKRFLNEVDNEKSTCEHKRKDHAEGVGIFCLDCGKQLPPNYR